MLMMVGLPSIGKTTWANRHCQEFPEKRYTILGTNYIMGKMKVTGLGRRGNYTERFHKLYKLANNVLSHLFVLASRQLRNYIIDQVSS